MDQQSISCGVTRCALYQDFGLCFLETRSLQLIYTWEYIPSTMLLSFVLILYWCVVYMILGLIVLACIPTFRVTLLNAVAFVLGAWPGTYAYIYTSNLMFDHFALRLGPLEHYPVASTLIGAVTVGTLFVWLKLRFIKSSDSSRFL
jgi:hypothetical protein